MINLKKINQISDTNEGKSLIAAIAILTSLDSKDLESEKWGGNVHPDDALERVVDLANKIYHEKEWMSEQIIKQREIKLNKILD